MRGVDGMKGNRKLYNNGMIQGSCECISKSDVKGERGVRGPRAPKTATATKCEEGGMRPWHHQPDIPLRSDT